jgi:cell division protein ZapA (FtsZ GTPase activity inhibitor)
MQIPPSGKQTVALDVAGQRIRLASNGNEQHLEQLAVFVNKRVEEVQRSAKGVPPATLLALVALDLADELTSTRRKAEETHRELMRNVTDAESRVRTAEDAARVVIGEALAEIDQAIAADDAEYVRKARATLR